MSHTELHTGKLRLIEENISLDYLKEWLDFNKDKYKVDDLGAEYIEIYNKEKEYKEDGYITHIYYKTKLYEVITHKIFDECDYLNQCKKNDDESIDFTVMFYNGGTCFSEMLEESLSELNSK